MAEVTYGQLESWDDANVASGSEFMKLNQGSNQIRIFTNPYQFIVHWVKDSSGANRKIKCAVENCPLCKKGVKTQYRWYLGVIDRKVEQTKILEVSSQIFVGIKTLVNKPKWGDVKEYDVDITRMSPGSQPLYNVSPEPKTPLTSEEETMIKAFKEGNDILKLTKPSAPEEILEKLGVSGNTGPQYSVGTKTYTNTAANVESLPSVPSVSAEDFNFGDDDL